MFPERTAEINDSAAPGAIMALAKSTAFDELAVKVIFCAPHYLRLRRAPFRAGRRLCLPFSISFEDRWARDAKLGEELKISWIYAAPVTVEL